MQLQIYVRMQFLEFTGSTLKKSLQLQLYPPSKFLHLCIQSLTGTHSFISKSREINVFINDVAVNFRDEFLLRQSRSLPVIGSHVAERRRTNPTRVKKYCNERIDSFFSLLLIEVVCKSVTGDDGSKKKQI